MKVNAIRTSVIKRKDNNLLEILDRFIKKMPERSVLAISSKIIALCEGRVIEPGDIEKTKLIQKEADVFLLPSADQNHILTIKNNILIPSAGIDESNSDGGYVLWPADPQKWANKIRSYLKKRLELKEIGAIVTDSRTTPLRWGTSGVAVAHSGFSATNDYIGRPDLFGRPLQVTKANVADALAAAAVLVMGEGNEQTPMALISDLPFVNFQKNNPSKKELANLTIPLEDDIYSPLLKSVEWRKR